MVGCTGHHVYGVTCHSGYLVAVWTWICQLILASLSVFVYYWRIVLIRSNDILFTHIHIMDITHYILCVVRSIIFSMGNLENFLEGLIFKSFCSMFLRGLKLSTYPGTILFSSSCLYLWCCDDGPALPCQVHIVFGIELRALWTQGKRSTTELHPHNQSPVLISFFGWDLLTLHKLHIPHVRTY